MYAKDGDRWGDPRARLPAGEKWTAAEPKGLTAFGLGSEPAGHLAELASALLAAYVQVAAGLPGGSALEVVGGKLKLAKLGKADEPELMPPSVSWSTACCPGSTSPNCCWRSPN
ncbi:hypothetical protein MOV08_43500 [Streptomyces yunnanensis]|uniref:Uncharacterized protein n=1 Tax=Streptomyces yunnanensis TaxID=156453 RepID=A0ABY8AMV5_9ACTN|nr:hypothetical protein [Streptomyces yunnanensis]WEB37942.1 hypothetical protein MOV08_00465 [Streptomyces yunnanensis]WEB45479.1 hypothetical protein MOV08_43500 [Streptomyces yunnanensis]